MVKTSKPVRKLGRPKVSSEDKFGSRIVVLFTEEQREIISKAVMVENEREQQRFQPLGDATWIRKVSLIAASKLLASVESKR